VTLVITKTAKWAASPFCYIRQNSQESIKRQNLSPLHAAEWPGSNRAREMHWITLIEHNLNLLYGLVALVSLVVGSFLNVVIYRLPKMLDYDWRRECAALAGRE